MLLSCSKSRNTSPVNTRWAEQDIYFHDKITIFAFYDNFNYFITIINVDDSHILCIVTGDLC